MAGANQHTVYGGFGPVISAIKPECNFARVVTLGDLGLLSYGTLCPIGIGPENSQEAL